MPCYHEMIRDQIKNRPIVAGQKYLFPEEAGWLMLKIDLNSLSCTEQPCIHWPIFTVVEGSPYPAYHGEPECYLGSRDNPRPLMGIIRLHDQSKIKEIENNKAYLKNRLKYLPPSPQSLKDLETIEEIRNKILELT